MQKTVLKSLPTIFLLEKEYPTQERYVQDIPIVDTYDEFLERKSNDYLNYIQKYKILSAETMTSKCGSYCKRNGETVADEEKDD